MSVVRIDHELCSGSGHCADIAPGLFTVRERRGWLTERSENTPADPVLIRRAAESCPWFALSYTDDEESR